MKTVPDKCPFCESPIMVHGGNMLMSSNGGFATYECRTSQDVEWDNDQFNRVGQSDVCRFREVQLLTKQRDEARERIKRLEENGDDCANLLDAIRPNTAAFERWCLAKEAKP